MVVYMISYEGIGEGNDPPGRANSFADHDKDEPVCTKVIVVCT